MSRRVIEKWCCETVTRDKVRLLVRVARPEDAPAREELLRQGFASHYTDAFLHFFFQELTLQCVVLGAAVLFIFVGAPLWACVALLPLAAAFVAIAVLIAHAIAADNQIQSMRAESCGWVAEARARVVGTASASEYRGPRDSGWLHALAVGAPWRRRGVGRALVGAARAWAAREGLESLEAATSAAGGGGGRALLHACGWTLRHSYHRPLLGAALTLPMVQLGLDLPHA